MGILKKMKAKTRRNVKQDKMIIVINCSMILKYLLTETIRWLMKLLENCLSVIENGDTFRPSIFLKEA